MLWCLDNIVDDVFVIAFRGVKRSFSRISAATAGRFALLTLQPVPRWLLYPSLRTEQRSPAVGSLQRGA